MLLILNRFIAALATLPKRRITEIRFSDQNPMSCVEKLGSLQNHFYHVLVAMPSRTTRGQVRKIEYVHGRVKTS